MGDFNINYSDIRVESNHGNSRSTKLLFADFMQYNGFIQLNSITNKNNRILDLVFSNVDVTVINALDTILPEDGHHPALSFSVNCRMKRKEFEHFVVNKYNFKKINYDTLYYGLSMESWDTVLEETDVDVAVNNFYALLYAHMNNCIQGGKEVRNSYPLWFTREIIGHIKVKNKLLRKYRRTHSEETLAELKTLRKEIKKLLKLAKRDYYVSLSTTFKTNPKEFWNHARRMMSTSSGIDALLDENNVFITDKFEISESFAKYFCSTFTQESNGEYFFPDAPNGDPGTDHFEIRELDLSSIKHAIAKLKNSKSLAFDSVPAFIVKGCGELLLSPLHYIYNLSLKTQNFPALWKIAKIVPIPKKSGNVQQITEYRPISILSVFSKVFETALHHKLLFSLKRVMSPYQHGYMAGRSTTTNLLMLSSYATSAINDNLQLDIIYTDFTKAFDSVNHKLLIDKLYGIGFSTSFLRFVMSYLNGRFFRVEFRGVRSQLYKCTSGVPQGSVLGPLFFTLFINDIPNILVSSTCLMFADDVKILRVISSVSDCLELQRDIDCVYQWSVDNCLTLNIKKCAAMTITRKRQPIISNYTLNNQYIIRKEVHKDLGIYFTSDFTFKFHIDSACLRARQVSGNILRNTRDFNDPQLRMILFNTYVRPIIEYGTVIWHPSLKHLIAKLERVQNLFIRSTYRSTFRGTSRLDYSATEARKFFGVPTLEKRRVYLLLTFYHGVLHGQTDISEILQQICLNVRRQNSRHYVPFYKPIYRSALLTNTSLVVFLSTCNEAATSIDVFSGSSTEFRRQCSVLLF